MKTGMKIGLSLAVVSAAYVAWRVIQFRDAKRKAEADTQKLIDDSREMLEALQTAKAARDKRIAGATFRTTRFGGLDGQCLGMGKPPHGYIIEGSTYADNVAVGAGAACETFGREDGENITNFFCCRRDTMPTVLKVQVEAATTTP